MDWNLSRFLTDRFIEIPSPDWQQIKAECSTLDDRRALAQHLAELLAPFPAPSRYFTEETVRKDFERLERWQDSVIQSDAPLRCSYAFPVSDTAYAPSLHGQKTCDAFFIPEILKTNHREHLSVTGRMERFQDIGRKR